MGIVLTANRSTGPTSSPESSPHQSYKRQGAPAEGQIVNVSGVGALVGLNEWADLPVGEALQLEIFSRLEPTKRSSRGILKPAGRASRVSRKNREVAVTFLEEIDQDSLYSL